MTGYGIEYSFSGGKKVVCWIKSLNHRFLEIYFDIPYEFSHLEQKMRGEIRKRVKRGKIEVFIRTERITPILFPFRKGRDIMSIFLSSLYKFEESREKEGEIIKSDLFQRMERLKDLISEIEKLHQNFPRYVKQMLVERISQIKGEIGIYDIPEELIDKAGVIHIVRKADISEEIARVSGHINAFEDELEREGDGKKLMFIAQEILRELNTMGAKASDIKIQEKVIEAKLEVERIREQLYNVE